MKCLVVNLDRSVGRLGHMTAEFAKIGLPFERISAVDGATANIAAHHFLTTAEVCCFLSHRICWQTIADGADRYGAIFEDDVVFSRDAASLLSNDDWVPSNADLVKLETTFNKVRLAKGRVAIRNGYSLARLVGEHVGAAGYIISKAAAQKLLRRTRRPTTFTDHVLFSPNLLTCALNTNYQLLPALCIQTGFHPGRETLPTLLQADAPPRRKPALDKVFGEASRALAHLRNQTMWGTETVARVEFRNS